MKKRILVTGACGYIGRHAVKALLDMGAEVIATDLREAPLDSRASFKVCDVFADTEGAFERFGRPDACLHLAWKEGFIHNSDAHILNLADHYRLIQNLIKGGLSQIAVMGTMHEIGYHEGAVDENTPANPRSLYGVAKNALRQSAELLCQREGAVYQWLRAYYITGDDDRNNSIFTKINQAAREGKTAFPFTSGKNQYDFIDVAQLGGLLAACVMQTRVAGVINCSSGTPTPLKDKVESYIREHSLSIELAYGAFPDRAYDSPAIWGDITKLEAALAAAKESAYGSCERG